MRLKPYQQLDACILDDGQLIIPNRHRRLFDSIEGLTASAIFNLPGAIVSGHPRRHVMRFQFADVSCFLKKEHHVPRMDRWKNAVAGFGCVSNSVREAITLHRVAQLGMRVPDWLAAGETKTGQAFLLVRSLDNCISLRDFMERRLSLNEREIRATITELAYLVAHMHNLGISNPDLVAKHIFLEAGQKPAIIDWARGKCCRAISLRRRAYDLAALHASIRPDLLTTTPRLSFLTQYLRHTKLRHSDRRRLLQWIEARANKIETRSSFRDQRLPKRQDSQSLFWAAGERFCLSELGRQSLQVDAFWDVAYPPVAAAMATSEQRVDLTNGMEAIVIRRRNPISLWKRLRQFVGGESYVSPECHFAANLLRQERLGQDRRLLAFGQWERQPHVIDSFVAYALMGKQSGEGGKD